MSLTSPLGESHLQFTSDLRICRMLNGLWQVSGAHGAINPQAAIQSMLAYHDAGFTTWDLADHYGPAEDFIGAFRELLAAERGTDALAQVQAFTKWVPRAGSMTRQAVESAINLSLRRMGVATLDLLQFHWWEYADPGYLDALTYLDELRQEGKIRYLALTNFDTQRLREIVARGIPIVSNQVQYSLVDRRPEVHMAHFCQEHNIHLLAYGSVCGGLLSQKYLWRPEPKRGEIDTASLHKYKQMVDAWGGWDLFQELLATLKQIADKHSVSITNIATRYVLERPVVAGVIVGARLGISNHITDNARIFGFQLDNQDHEQIEAVLSRSRNLYELIGDCGDEYRR